jgi:hypothetical protein
MELLSYRKKKYFFEVFVGYGAFRYTVKRWKECSQHDVRFLISWLNKYKGNGLDLMAKYVSILSDLKLLFAF